MIYCGIGYRKKAKKETNLVCNSLHANASGSVSVAEFRRQGDPD